MKIKKNRQFYIERAKKDFKTLVIYFNVTRPKHEPIFRNPATNVFNLNKLLKMFDLLRDWKNKPYEYKREHKFQQSIIQKKINYTFGIPSRLIEKVLGCYIDENNKQKRISIDEVVTPLIEEGFLKKINAGSKIDFNTGGKKFCWSAKYRLANSSYWMRLLKDPRFDKLETYPHASERVKKIIFEWKKNNMVKEVE